MAHYKPQINAQTCAFKSEHLTHTHTKPLYIHVCDVRMTHVPYQGVVRAVTGSVSWALPLGFVTDFRGGGGGQEEDGGKDRKKRRRGRDGSERQRGTSDILAKLIFIYH